MIFSHDAAASLVSQLDFSKAADGLLPVITVDAEGGQVLMQAWMNKEALLETLTTGRVCYYSRSKQGLWRKGDTSGHVQTLVACYTDCDNDSILLEVLQIGAACHTMRRHCFYQKATEDGTFKTIIAPLIHQ
jgi:phosphoribosyl-AMP cyclohydrolase